MTKKEVIAAIKECFTTLSHVPKYEELREASGVQTWDIKKHFGTYRKALTESGMEPLGKGYMLDHKVLFTDWSRVTRQIGKIPKQAEYEQFGKHKARTLVKRCGAWRNVPRCLLEYIRKDQLEGDWKDVQGMILRYLEATERNRSHAALTASSLATPQINLDQPMYGAPMMSSPLAFAPINEMAVVFLFGAVARQMGFVVTRLQPEFPDCEALRRVDQERWQRKRIEFEYESRNFMLHQHDILGCDIIVCWKHNWPDCPLEVVELSKLDWSQLMSQPLI
jgi:hypothetical protein